MPFDVLPIDATRSREPRVRRLESTTFVVQRRVNIPLMAVQRSLADRTRLVADYSLDLGVGVLTNDEALHPIAPFSAHQSMPTWTGCAQLLSMRGRQIATIELDVSMWSINATCVTLRPAARHPERWSARRLRSYFTLAHAAADAISLLLVRRAIAAADADGRNEFVTRPTVLPVGATA